MKRDDAAAILLQFVCFVDYAWIGGLVAIHEKSPFNQCCSLQPCDEEKLIIYRLRGFTKLNFEDFHDFKPVFQLLDDYFPKTEIGRQDIFNLSMKILTK